MKDKNLNITNKQTEILVWLYKLRFLSRLHLQTLLKHKDPKRINEWLKDLVNKKIIGRHYERNKNDNNKPAVYFLIAKSREFLINQKNINERVLKRVYQDKDRTEKLVKHCLLIADFYIKTLGEKEIIFLTRTELSNYLFLPARIPDAYIVKNKKRYFFDVVDKETPKFALRKKIDDYWEYYDDKTWQKNIKHDFPTILFCCEDEVNKRYLIKYIKEKLDDYNDQIFFYVSGLNFKWEEAR